MTVTPRSHTPTNPARRQYTRTRNPRPQGTAVVLADGRTLRIRQDGHDDELALKDFYEAIFARRYPGLVNIG